MPSAFWLRMKTLRKVSNKVNSHRLRQVQENRKRLIPIIDSILFLGRQNIPLRGHRDDGDLLQQKETDGSVANEGNFRELLRYRINAGDHELKIQMETARARATYISKTTQNQLIDCIGSNIQAKILGKVRDAEFYAVMFDETTDGSHTSQMSLVARYPLNGKVHEDFLGFIDLHALNYDDLDIDEIEEPVLTGKIIGESVVKILNSFHLDLKYCVGIATDGCSVMASKQCGAVVEIQKVAKNAVWCPCNNHALNLTLSRTSDVQSVRNCLGTIGEVISFFSASAKRNYVLKKVVGGQLVSLCETRWVERHDAVQIFYSEFLKIVECLERISEWDDRTTATKAQALVTAITTCEFIVALSCTVAVFSLTMQLSKVFQKERLDVGVAKECISNLKAVLETRRTSCEETFTTVFKESVTLMEGVGIAPTVPRLTSRQTRRANHPSSCPEEYYRRSIYVPMLDALLADLNARFETQSVNYIYLFNLLPHRALVLNKEEIDHTASMIFEKYGSIVNIRNSILKTEIQAEIEMWKTKWVQHQQAGKELPKNRVLETLAVCDEDLFPHVNRSLRILGSLPVSVASAERSFSTLRRLKTWLRTRMSNERLTGLALMNVHRDINIEIDEIIDLFANSGSRKLDFVVL